MTYLESFPLHSNKGVAYNKWLKLLRVVEDGGRGKDYETIKKMAQNINKFEDEEKVHSTEKDCGLRASHVYSRDGRRYKGLLYSSDNDNSSTNRDKNL